MRLTTDNVAMDNRIRKTAKEITDQFTGRLLGMAGVYYLDKADVLQFAVNELTQALVAVEKESIRDMMASEICNACTEEGRRDCADCLVLKYTR